MDFSSLADNVFLEIFRYLPLPDQIRVGGVSAAFRRMSDIAISETKSLDLTDDALKNIPPIYFSRLLNLCQGSLKKCNLVGSPGHGRQYYRCMANAFNEYSYPQLNTLGFDSHYNSIIGISLHQYACSLKSLAVQHAINFPDVMMERLEMLDFWCNDSTVQTLTGKIPNLRHFKVRDNGLSKGALDTFLGTMPQLASLSVHIEYGRVNRPAPLDLEGNGMTAFWELKSLRRFEVSYRRFDQREVIIGDDALMRIATFFPRLRILSLCRVRSGDNGVAALSALRDLRELKLERLRETVDLGLRKLFKCECLEKLELGVPLVRYYSYLSAVTATILLQSCPRLSFIACDHLFGIHAAEDVVDFLTSLSILEKRVIRFRFDWSQGIREIWGSSEVKDALKKLDKEAGVVVQFVS